MFNMGDNDIDEPQLDQLNENQKRVFDAILSRFQKIGNDNQRNKNKVRSSIYFVSGGPGTGKRF